MAVMEKRKMKKQGLMRGRVWKHRPTLRAESHSDPFT